MKHTRTTSSIVDHWFSIAGVTSASAEVVGGESSATVIIK